MDLMYSVSFHGYLKFFKVVEGTPRLETFEIVNSTSHEIAASAVWLDRPSGSERGHIPSPGRNGK